MIAYTTMQPEHKDGLAWLVLVDILYFTGEIISKAPLWKLLFTHNQGVVNNDGIVISEKVL